MTTSKIWIIDDNPIDSYVIKTMLEVNDLANNIEVFSDNKEALKNLDQLNTTNSKESILVITENKTNAVNGWDLITDMSEKKKDLDIKFHMTSELYSNKDFKEFKATEPLLSINKKPLRLDDLKSIINE
ncbi:hypothetical protein [Nonlabens sp. Asnod3-A02]|uniref:hypothetical protein n=1 Tax=Nonlabens sp. Asnod3-A02 TaxID=3160579 RepID=UPI0038637B74